MPGLTQSQEVVNTSPSRSRTGQTWDGGHCLVKTTMTRIYYGGHTGVRVPGIELQHSVFFVAKMKKLLQNREKPKCDLSPDSCWKVNFMTIAKMYITLVAIFLKSRFFHFWSHYRFLQNLLLVYKGNYCSFLCKLTRDSAKNDSASKSENFRDFEKMSTNVIYI